MRREVRGQIPSLVLHSGQMFDSHLQNVSFINSSSRFSQVRDQDLQLLETFVDASSSSLPHYRLRNFPGLKVVIV